MHGFGSGGRWSHPPHPCFLENKKYIHVLVLSILRKKTLDKFWIRYMRCTSYNILTMLWNKNMIYKSPTIIFLAICGFLRFRIFRCKEISYHIFSSYMYRKHDIPNILKICEYDQLYLQPNPQVFGVLGFSLFCILQKEWTWNNNWL